MVWPFSGVRHSLGTGQHVAKQAPLHLFHAAPVVIPEPLHCDADLGGKPGWRRGDHFGDAALDSVGALINRRHRLGFICQGLWGEWPVPFLQIVEYGVDARPLPVQRLPLAY